VRTRRLYIHPLPYQLRPAGFASTNDAAVERTADGCQRMATAEPVPVNACQPVVLPFLVVYPLAMDKHLMVQRPSACESNPRADTLVMPSR